MTRIPYETDESFLALIGSLPFIALAAVGVVFIVWGIKVLRSNKVEGTAYSGG